MTSHETRVVPAWRDRLGGLIMFLVALGALGAFVSGIITVRSATPETVWVEIWRTAAYLVFAGMFVRAGLRPRASAGIWELAFAHKAAMAVASLWLTESREATEAGVVDAVVAALIGLAYLLTRAWLGWRRGRGGAV